MEQSLPSVLKKLSRWLSNKPPALFVSLGLFIFLVGATHYYQIRILSFTKAPESVSQAGDLPKEIIIPSINIDQKIESGGIDAGVWQISYTSPTFLSTSARPGGGGNVVIYGHNKKAIFGNLPYLSVGQEVNLIGESGKIYKYKVTNKYFVRPDRVDLVSPTDHEELTIYTCWGLFDSQRVIIKALPI